MIPAERAHLHVAAITDSGRKGKNNEDRYAVLSHELGKRDSTPSLFAIVADGVGGHRAGEVAAELAIETIGQITAESNGKNPLETLDRAIQQANQAIYSQAISDLSQRGMSTTSACAWVIGDRLYIASVGDSRIYLQRESTIQQLTTDHTWVQEAINSGALSPDQARDHPNAHVIRRHLGSQQPVVPDFRLRLSREEDDSHAEANQGMRLLPGDRVLICSDGLTDLVADGEILGVLKNRNRDEALKELVDLANERGGHDNITIVSLEVPERYERIKSTPLKSAKSTLLWFGLVFGSLFLLGGILIGSLFWFSNQIKPTLTPGTIRAPVLQPQEFPDQAVSPKISITPTAAEGESTSTPTITGTEEPRAGEARVQPTYTSWPTSTLEPH